MKPITINLATRPFRNNRAIAGVLGSAAALLVLLGAYNAWVFVSYAGTYAEIQAQERADRARLAALEIDERALAKEIAARDFRTVFERGRFANEVILKRAFSWTLLFNTLESVIPAEVMMSAIRPSISGDGIQVRVEGLARSDDALYGFQGRLMGNAAFAKVTPISERRLNPGRPDITFAMSFDYLPVRAVAPPQAVTASGPGAPPPAPPAGSAAAPGAPAATPPVAAAPIPGDAPARAGASAAVVARASPPRGIVGRDGRPRDGAAPARVVAAPGGVRVPASMSAAAVPGSGARPAARSGGDPRRGTAPAPAGAAAGGGGSVPEERGSRASGDPRKGSAATGGTALAAERAALPDDPAGAAPAVRLDVPLRFAERPVREVYDALSRAHGVQFALDPAVDGAARVSADLAGRHLPDAIAVVGRAAGHRIVRLGEGRYRVALASGGETLADRPVREETLAPLEGAP